MSASVKIRQLEPKLLGLQNQYQHLLKERQQEIAVLLSIVDLAHLDDKTLMGVFLFLKDKITTQDPIVEAWHAAGEKFLRQNKPKSQHRDQQCKTGKQQNTGHQPSKQSDARSQASDKKSATPNSNPPHQATDQSPQNLSSQGEE